MRLLTQTLCLALALSLSCAAPSLFELIFPEAHDQDKGEETPPGASPKPDRCDGIEFDAIAPDEKGITYFFKGDYVWKGFEGEAELFNTSFKELDDHPHLGKVDAAFRMHSEDEAEHHDHTFFFQDDKVFSFYNHTLEAGYPKDIGEVFPGVPSHLDAAVECPKGECSTDSVLFFKGDSVCRYDLKTKTVKPKVWSHLPNCTSAYRWQERYYCFHGHNFTRFHPLTGAVITGYPKDARHYFMKCETFGHGNRTFANCTDAHLDAVTSDDKGKSYSFRGKLYMRLDTARDGWHAFPISSTWKEVDRDVDAVFSYDEKMYMIKDDQVYIYKSAGHYTLIEGYPKPLKEELGIEGPVDAAFVCQGQPIVHIIQGQQIRNVDLSATPRSVINEFPMPFLKVDAAKCGPYGVVVFLGTEFFRYDSAMTLSSSTARPESNKVPETMLGCVHKGGDLKKAREGGQ